MSIYFHHCRSHHKMFELFVSFLMFTCWMGAVSSLLPPQQVTKSLLNLNFELRWTAPSDATNRTLYSVKYSLNGRRWRSITHCTSIGRTVCDNMATSLVDQLNRGKVKDALLSGFDVRLIRHDGPLESTSPSVTVNFTPYTEATISAPSIKKLDATSVSQRVGLLAPQTPFPGTGRVYVLMDDRNLPGVSKVYYNYTLWQIPHGATSEPMWMMVDRLDSIPARRNLHNFTDLQLTNLQPNTEYALVVQARIGRGSYSNDKSRITWTTLEAAPNEGPLLLPLDVAEIDCSRPNSRDVGIKWQPPLKQMWNGNNIFYELQFSKKNLGGEQVIRNITSSTSTTVYGLSRWDLYDVVVFANTSAGGTASLSKSLPATVVGMANSKPDNIQILTKPSSSTQVISWQPPPEYQQCILGYYVTLQPDPANVEKHDLKREVTVMNATSVEIKRLEPQTYMVEVAAIVKTGFNNSSQGLAANIRLMVGSEIPIDATVSIACVGFFILLILIVTAARKIIRSCKDDKFKSLQDNKILMRAYSQTYSQHPRQFRVIEKETFDVPNQRDCVECETKLLSCDSTTSNQSNTTGYSTDKSGLVDGEMDVSLSRTEGKTQNSDIDVLSSLLREESSSDEEVKDSFLERTLGAVPAEEISQKHLASSNQSSSSLSGGPTDPVSFPGDSASTPASGYTPMSFCLPSRQASLNDDPSAKRKASRVSCDSVTTSPSLEKYPCRCALDYTILANSVMHPVQLYPLAVTKCHSGEDSSHTKRCAAKINLSSHGMETDKSYAFHDAPD
ncbi:uncharacterized protein LOC110982827 isoform X2 [Acanthaster planci]|uniref:Uncharacterized protein LOC110982827 isoform X2 n=1 Tax=Acanthaster planci TaxID=133434 RepID=A0A8B7YV96_ACAPL|nr:uncharacterized protein LOC110982827 isoform X2 [Acanthaster planci]